MTLLLNLLILSVTIFLVAHMMPSIRIKNFGTAVVVAIVYSIVNFLFGWLLLFLAIPLVLVTFGLFIFVINAILLWITDKMIDGFEIKSFTSTLIASFFISIISSVLRWIF